MQKVVKFSIGGWHLSVRAEVFCGLSLGFSVEMMSWRRLYPWFYGSVCVGPLAVVIDVTRPDEIALRTAR